MPISDSDLWIIYCKKTINSHGIFTANGEAVGQAIDFAASFYDHSCRPNLSITFDGKILVLRSLDDDVDVRDVKRAFVSYSEALEEGGRRREKLLDNYAFRCRCERCLESKEQELSALRCQGCMDGAIPFFTAESAVCPSCGRKATRPEFNHALSLITNIPARIEKDDWLSEADKDSMFAKEKQLTAIDQLILDAFETLAPSNILLLDLYVTYFQKVFTPLG